MKVHELIKIAVEKEDWLLVCAAYEVITGEKIEPPSKKEKNLLTLEVDPETLKSLGINLSQEENSSPGVFEDVEEEEEQEEDFSMKRQPSNDKDDKKKRAAIKLPMEIPTKRVNEFVDDLTLESSDLKENNPVLASVYSKVPKKKTKRQETPYKVDVVCSYCNSKDSVSPALAVGYSEDAERNTYKCNSCCTHSGRLKVDRLKERGNE